MTFIISNWWRNPPCHFYISFFKKYSCFLWKIACAKCPVLQSRWIQRFFDGTVQSLKNLLWTTNLTIYSLKILTSQKQSHQSILILYSLKIFLFECWPVFACFSGGVYLGEKKTKVLDVFFRSAFLFKKKIEKSCFCWFKQASR